MRKVLFRGALHSIISVSSGFCVILFILFFVQGSSDIMQTWMIRTLLNAVTENKEVVPSYYIYIGVLILIEVLFGVLSGWLIEVKVIQRKEKLQIHLVQHLLKCTYSVFSMMGVGELQTRVQSDSIQVLDGIRYFFRTIIYGIVLLIIPLLITFIINWQMALLCLIMVPVITAASVKLSNIIGELAKEAQSQNGRANRLFQEFIWQIPVNKSYSAESEWLEHLNSMLDEVCDVQKKKLRANMMFEPFLNVVQILPQLVIMSVGGISLFKGVITLGDLLIFTILFNYISNGLISIPHWVADMRRYWSYEQRVNEILSFPCSEGSDETRLNDNDIVLKDMCFSYKNEKFSLNSISMTIKSGMHVAIVGESGCGKSTLLKILSGLYRPSKGIATVLGYDLFKCRSELLFTHLALLLQNTYLFPGTIKDNLSTGNGTISDDQIKEACKKAKIWKWIITLPEGLDTPILEFSNNISGGQLQRIGIARAILRNADIWLIDEATSSLDNQTALEVESNIREIVSERTTVTVTHRLHNMDYYDIIFVISNNGIVECGTHNELLEKDNVYADLYKCKEKYSADLI